MSPKWDHEECRKHTCAVCLNEAVKTKKTLTHLKAQDVANIREQLMPDFNLLDQR